MGTDRTVASLAQFQKEIYCREHWVAKQQGKLIEVRRSQEHRSILDRHFTPSISPPKYKGSKVTHDERITGMWKLYNLLTQHLDLRFSKPLDSPNGSFGRSRLEILADQYDACLGAVVGLYCVNGNPYAWIAGNEHQGEMLLLVDKWLKERLDERGINMKRLS